VAAKAGAAEGDPRVVYYTWEGPLCTLVLGKVRSYLPSDGGAPRLVAGVWKEAGPACLCVWDTGTGTFLGALQGLDDGKDIGAFVTYQRPSDGRPRVAAVFDGGGLRIWDGDDFQVFHTTQTSVGLPSEMCLAVYEEPTSGTTTLVTG
jgi:hypothetical protein